MCSGTHVLIYSFDLVLGFGQTGLAEIRSLDLSHKYRNTESTPLDPKTFCEFRISRQNSVDDRKRSPPISVYRVRHESKLTAAAIRKCAPTVRMKESFLSKDEAFARKHSELQRDIWFHKEEYDFTRHLVLFSVLLTSSQFAASFSLSGSTRLQPIVVPIRKCVAVCECSKNAILSNGEILPLESAPPTHTDRKLTIDFANTIPHHTY